MDDLELIPLSGDPNDKHKYVLDAVIDRYRNWLFEAITWNERVIGISIDEEDSSLDCMTDEEKKIITQALNTLSTVRKRIVKEGSNVIGKDKLRSFIRRQKIDNILSKLDDE